MKGDFRIRILREATKPRAAASASTLTNQLSCTWSSESEVTVIHPQPMNWMRPGIFVGI